MKKYGIALKMESRKNTELRINEMSKDIVEMFDYHRMPSTDALKVLEVAKEKVLNNKDHLDHLHQHQAPLYQSGSLK